MGSFNVACSISNLSIHVGDPIVFIPLVPNVFPRSSGKHDFLYRENIHKVGVQSLLLGAERYFYPLCLPIFGTYGDYGLVETVKKDSNTQAVEQFFGIDIEDFIRSIVCGRDIADYMSDTFDHYAVNQEICRSYDYSFGEGWLEKMGFDFDPILERYSFKDFPYSVEVLPPNARNEQGFVIYDEDDMDVARNDGYNARRDIQHQFWKLTGYYINVAEDRQRIVRAIENMSGMYIHREIFDALKASPYEEWGRHLSIADAYVSEQTLMELGFRKISQEEQINYDPHHKTIYRRGDAPYDVKVGWSGVQKVIHQRHNEYYVFGDTRRSADEIRREWKRMTGTNPDKTFPEPKDIKHCSDKEAQAIEAAFTELTGAHLGWAETYANYPKDSYSSVWSLKKFVAIWKEATGEVLDICYHLEKPKHIADFEAFQKRLVEYNNREEPLTTLVKYGSVDEQKARHKLNESIRKSQCEKEDRMFIPTAFVPHPEDEEYEYEFSGLADPLGYFSNLSGDDFYQHYKDWRYFADIYRQPIIEGNDDLKEAFNDYYLFQSIMWRCNRFFFPAMNGEQCGSDASSMLLTEATREILDKRLAER